ncbi:glycosyl hydrolase family 17 protein [Glaciecola petra]|uniref:Endo-1,3-beta-glucanase btgC n=1 Tax=Glaciecola petra TaxID=3075602 RepID=A0ABU2ZV00_9ALTE|nr:glycosyl hydrolase family 17 protein [Aestuariibacter sp. P117]MDT0596154.1 glycosyl hydrolase family 17 [Aestuariibacter sp. P117]
MKFCTATLTLIMAILIMQGCSMVNENKIQESEPIFYPTIDNKWIGLGIAYGSYRDGESPDLESVSSEADILEDLTILTSNKAVQWNLIRMYAADPASEQVLKTIKKHNLPVKVMQGAWLSGKDTDAYNNNQINEVIRLANEYPDIIVAVNLGNEIFVDWSYHKFTVEQMPMYLEWVEKVQASVSVPVTLADDYNFWNKPWSAQIAEKLDFIVLHAYAMWNSQTLDNAVKWTDETYQDIQSRYPEKQIVLGESGWTTSSISTNGDERLIIAEATEDTQASFVNEYRAWLQANKIASFYFEAFDEKWKGGADKPDGIAEKNWGLYRSDRSPKKVVASN